MGGFGTLELAAALDELARGLEKVLVPCPQGIGNHVTWNLENSL